MIKDVYIEESDLAVVLNKDFKASDLNKYCFDKGFTLSKILVKKQSLEDQFLQLVK